MSERPNDFSIYFIEKLLSEEMVSNGFPLVYKGELNHKITKLFTSMAENKISKTKKEISARMKVFHVMVECLQNITKHSDDFDDPENPVGNGLFIVGERENSYYVITGNLIKNKNVKNLQIRLDELNNMNKDELNEAHKKQMKSGSITDKGGAGLGLIDIVRKTGEKLVYQLIPVDDNHHFFILKVNIPVL